MNLIVVMNLVDAMILIDSTILCVAMKLIETEILTVITTLDADAGKLIADVIAGDVRKWTRYKYS
ncbi:hypothetical protein [Sporosarcina thermotolerans]